MSGSVKVSYIANPSEELNMIKFLKNAVPEILFRIVIGLVFIESGWGKFHDLGKVISYFESLGIPYANLQAPFVAGVELVAGAFVLIGLFTRFASLPLIGIMIVAIRTAKWEDVTDFSSLLGISEFLYVIILIWLVAQGSKYISADALICRFWKGNTCKKD